MQLLIVRGLPGSGKSTFARGIAHYVPGWIHLETDMFFMRDGVYRYDGSRIRDAHDWCQRNTKLELSKGNNVVVANTFCEEWEITPYRRMCENISVVTMVGHHQNVHDVPAVTLEKMRRRFQRIAS